MASHAWSLAFTLALTVVVLPLLAWANSDADALDALHHSLIDPNNMLQSWDPTLVNPCSWFHVTCNQDHRVTRVDLGNSNLSGHLVPELGRLEYLQYLELFENNIQGTIPSELGNLKNLRSLDLFRNSISGSIPPTLGNLKSLLFLRLNDNLLTGRVPSEVASLPNLKVLNVSNNHLSSNIRTFRAHSLD